jgi:hypothetical protein
MNMPKDDQCLMEFRTAFNKLREWTDDHDPSALFDEAMQDEGLRNLCLTVGEKASCIEREES